MMLLSLFDAPWSCLLWFFFVSCVCCFFFFFSSRRRHTRCLSDWSSDVCSSDWAVLVNGTDRLPGLLATHGAAISEEIELPQGVLQELGVVPSYYLRYFYCHD